MTLFPRSPQAPEFQAITHLRLTSRRILDARDLTNGIDTAMIDCMHDVTTVMVQPSMERESLTEGSRVTNQGPFCPSLGRRRALVSRYH
jgi:hypothetical protein